MNGQIVGINTAIIGPANRGIGFTIPSNVAKKAYELLRGTGIPSGWAGVSLEDIDGPLAEELGIKLKHGALISAVVSNSPAERGGLSVGDVIVLWNRQPVDDANDLRIAIARTAPGSRVPVVLYRDGERQRLNITVGKRPHKVAN